MVFAVFAAVAVAVAVVESPHLAAAVDTVTKPVVDMVNAVVAVRLANWLRVWAVV